MEKLYDTSPEKIREKMEQLVSDMYAAARKAGYSTLHEWYMNGNGLKDPDIICTNCGRIVLVGRCCEKPTIVERKELTPEQYDRIVELTKAPANPTPELKQLMSRGKK